MKGLIIVDIPKNCRKCDISEKICIGEERRIDCPYLDYLVSESKERDVNCPIKPLPEKKSTSIALPSFEGKKVEDVINILFTTSQANWQSDGWNACIDEILKGASN